MIVRAIDGAHDWTYGKGKNDYRSDLLAVAQNIDTRLSSFLNDCFFATDAGIDWFNLLGSKDQSALNLAVRTVLLNTEFVTGIIQITFSLDAQRHLSIAYGVQTTFSQPIFGTFITEFGA